jgi:hypothetical protein
MAIGKPIVVTRIVNARGRWTGHLFQGRFGSVLMDEQHLLAGVRYVSLNPVRACLAARAEDWPWSSVRRIWRAGRSACRRGTRTSPRRRYFAAHRTCSRRRGALRRYPARRRNRVPACRTRFLLPVSNADSGVPSRGGPPGRKPRPGADSPNLLSCVCNMYDVAGFPLQTARRASRSAAWAASGCAAM